jgi:cytochrome c oxidase subunit II
MSPIRRASRALVARPAIVAIASCLAIGGCTPQSTLWPSGAGADRIASLSWFLIGVAAVVYVAVLATMFVAMTRNRDRPRDGVDLTPGNTRFVSLGGAVIPGVILAAVFVVGLSIMGAFPTRPPANQLTIHVVGHQWWWQADYDYPALQQRFTTANELHIPVGVPVKVLLTSADVIHSFWVPRLQGKLDVIPGDTNDIRLLAKQAGTYRGQCAEFCGLQHAHMGIVVVADPPAQFAKWATQQLGPGVAPHDSLTLIGQRVFVSGPCALCHTVRGTPAMGTVGPDLTHVGSRATIGAGLMPNTLASIEGWIANPQALKPGVQMPPNTQFSGFELRALADYVSSLK